MFEKRIILIDETYGVPRYATGKKHESPSSTAFLMIQFDAAETGRKEQKVQKTSAGSRRST